MEGAEAGSGRDHSGGRGGGHERAASSLRNRRGEHGVPCASYVKRATGTAANGRAVLAGPAPWYANKAAPRPMEGAGGGRGTRGHVFHYVTAARQRRWRRRAARLSTRCSRRLRPRAGSADGARTRRRTGEDADRPGECAAGSTGAGLGRPLRPGARLAGYVTAPAGAGLGRAGLGSGSGHGGRSSGPPRRRPSFLGPSTPSRLETGLGLGAILPISQIKKLRFPGVPRAQRAAE